MPVETRISPAFGDLVDRLITPDSLGQASIRTGISQAYLLQMRRGKVPSEGIIEKFTVGYADRGADLHVLRVAAGYEEDLTRADRVREHVTEYLLERKAISPAEVDQMWREIARSEDSDNQQ